jgi:hypothetical protein
MAGLKTEPTTHNNCSREALPGSYSSEENPKLASCLQKVDELCLAFVCLSPDPDEKPHRSADATPRKDFRIPDSGLHVNEFGGGLQAFPDP